MQQKMPLCNPSNCNDLFLFEKGLVFSQFLQMCKKSLDSIFACENEMRILPECIICPLDFRKIYTARHNPNYRIVNQITLAQKMCRTRPQVKRRFHSC